MQVPRKHLKQETENQITSRWDVLSHGKHIRGPSELPEETEAASLDQLTNQT